AGAPVDILLVELRLDRPDLLLQPSHKRQVAAVAAEERHRRMGVAIDERGQHRRPRGVDRLIARRGADVGPDRLDHAVAAAEPDDLALVEGAGHGEAHASSSGSSVSSASRSASALRSRWASSSSTSIAAPPIPFAMLSTTQIAA